MKDRYGQVYLEDRLGDWLGGIFIAIILVILAVFM